MKLEIENLLASSSPDECRKLAAVMILADGSIRRRKSRKTFQVVYYGRDVILHDIFRFFMKKGFDANVSAFLYPGKRTYETIYDFSIKSGFGGFSLSPSFKTSPGRLDKGEYLETPPPTIKFLYDEFPETKILAFRLTMSTEGSISVLENGTRFRLNLGCTHPMLAKEWQDFAENLGISMNFSGGQKNMVGDSRT